MLQVWRLKTTTGTGRNETAFLVAKEAIGFGWQVVGWPKDVGDYRRLALEEYPDGKWKPNLVRLVDDMKEGDLVWSRDQFGSYHIGSVSGPWEYRAGQEYRDHDVVNVRACEWRCVGQADEVPGAVRRTFNRRGATLEKIQGDTVRWASNALWQGFPGNPLAATDPTFRPDIWDLIGPEELEDIIALYLHRDGWAVWPSTKERSQPRYEFVLVDGEGHRAYVQVKSGRDQQLNPQGYADLAAGNRRVFLFAVSGDYGSQKPPVGVTCIRPPDVESFLRAAVPESLPLNRTLARLIGLRDAAGTGAPAPTLDPSDTKVYVWRLARFLAEADKVMSGSELAGHLNRNGMKTTYGERYAGGRGTYKLIGDTYKWLADGMGLREDAEKVAVSFVKDDGTYAYE
jgi:hypothetical protein